MFTEKSYNHYAKSKKAFMYKSLFLLTKSLICGNIIIKQG